MLGVKSTSKNLNKGAFLFGGILTLLHPDNSVPFFYEQAKMKELIIANTTISQTDSLYPTSQWVKTSDRLPDFDIPVLCIVDRVFLVCKILIDTNGNKYWFMQIVDDLVPLDCVTHWMPLPELPEDLK